MATMQIKRPPLWNAWTTHAAWAHDRLQYYTFAWNAAAVTLGADLVEIGESVYVRYCTSGHVLGSASGGTFLSLMNSQWLQTHTHVQFIRFH